MYPNQTMKMKLFILDGDTKLFFAKNNCKCLLFRNVTIVTWIDNSYLVNKSVYTDLRCNIPLLLFLLHVF